MSGGVWDFTNPASPTWTGTLIFLPSDADGGQSTVIAALGPAGGRIELPATKNGVPGVSPQLHNANLTQVAYNQPASASWVETSPGNYDLDFSLPAGAPGGLLGFLIQQAQDLLSPLVHQYQLRYDANLERFFPSAVKIGSWYNQTGIASTDSTRGQNRNLSFIRIPSQGFDWWPVVFASSKITGTINTRVDLVARLGAQTGSELARGPGPDGSALGPPLTAPPPVPVNQALPYFNCLLPTFGGGLLSDASGFAAIPSGTAATIYLNAEQQNSTTDTYSTDTTLFAVGVAPIPS